MTNFDYYTMQQSGKCRGCSSNLDKGQEVLHTYTTAGKGMHLFFCDDCQFEMAAMFVQRYDKLEDFGQEVVLWKINDDT